MLALVATFFVRILEGMFAIGVVGSTLVLLVTFVEDIETLFGMEDTPHT
jgi:hypothetical protein